MKIALPKTVGVAAIAAVSLMAHTTDAFVPRSIVSSSSTKSTTPTTLWYEPSNDPNAEQNRPNAWKVIARTEKWMSNTLSDAGGGNAANASETKGSEGDKSSGSNVGSPGKAVGNVGGASNPLSRKEVSYVCEASTDLALILANIFRKLKEFRIKGEKHGTNQEELIDESNEQGEQHKRITLRQTQVMVIPANKDLNTNFPFFDNLVTAINQARRNARDYVTEVSLERLDDRLYGDEDDQNRDWSVSVNFAHLHPKFGEKTPEQELKELQEEEEDGEVDLNLQEYKKRKMMARRSPYPSVVIEVRATPPPDFSQAPPIPPPPAAEISPDTTDMEGEDELGYKDEEVTSDFVLQLEALFSKSAHIKNEKVADDSNANDDKKTKKKNKDKFYDTIGSHIEEISMVTPLMRAQTWIADNDPVFDVTASGFTVSETKHVDEAYEFVFTNLAMQTSQFLNKPTFGGTGAQKRQYIVMSNFLTSSATSFEKFAKETMNIIQQLPVIKDKVELSCLHPEHIDALKRSPIPVFIMQWKD